MISVLLSLALAQEAALPVLAASEVHLKKRAALHYPPAASEDHPDSVRCVAQVDL